MMMLSRIKLFIHEGLSDKKFCDDLHYIDLSGMKLLKLNPFENIPIGCPIHLAVAMGK